MRKAFIVISVAGALLLRPLLAQDSTTETISIPVAGGTTDADGKVYQFKGTVTFPKPVPPVPPALPPYPAFAGPLDANGNYVRHSKPGDVVTLAGRFFGAAKGKVLFAGTEVPTIEWTDTTIRFALPAIPPGRPPHGGFLISVHRPDGSAVAVISENLYR